MPWPVGKSLGPKEGNPLEGPKNGSNISSIVPAKGWLCLPPKSCKPAKPLAKGSYLPSKAGKSLTTESSVEAIGCSL